MRNEVKIEIETADGQIVWKHYRFPSWKLTEKWASGFLGFLAQALKTGNINQAVKTTKTVKEVKEVKDTKIEDQNPVMRAEVEIILRNLGVKKKDTKRLLDRAGPCETVEEMVRKCLAGGSR